MESQAGKEAFESLRIAVVLDSPVPPAWIGSIVRELPIAAVVLMSARRKLARHSYLFDRYSAWDARRAHFKPDPLTPTDVSDLLGSLPTLTLDTLGLGLDVLLWLSDETPALAASPTRYGTWFLSHDDLIRTPQSEAYFPELIRHDPVSSSYLLAMNTAGKAFKKLAEAHTASEIGWSLARQQIAPLWKAATLPRAALLRVDELFQGGQFRNDQCLDDPSKASEDRYSISARRVSNSSVVRFAARNALRTVDRRLRYSGQETHWFVSYRTSREDFVANKGSFTPKNLRILPAPPGHFYADPFVLNWQGRTFLFVEDYLYAEARGVLSVLEMQPNGEFGSAQQILNCRYHLSYPFVFEHEGEVFMIPETLGARRIELYRAVEMPNRWKLERVLQDNVEAVDTTLWIEDGTFYFFTNLVRPGLSPNDLLFLFTADELTGQWRPHPCNPISYDVRTARGAGKLFRMGGKLVRPGQDCSMRYGYATQLNEVQVLNPKQYREAPLFRIEPNWTPHLIGTHTINSNEQVEVIDGQIYRAKYRK